MLMIHALLLSSAWADLGPYDTDEVKGKGCSVAALSGALLSVSFLSIAAGVRRERTAPHAPASASA